MTRPGTTTMKDKFQTKKKKYTFTEASIAWQTNTEIKKKKNN